MDQYSHGQSICWHPILFPPALYNHLVRMVHFMCNTGEGGESAPSQGLQFIDRFLLCD